MVVSEADCFMLVKMFDSNGDGLLSLIEYVTSMSTQRSLILTYPLVSLA